MSMTTRSDVELALGKPMGLPNHPVDSFILKITNRCNFDCDHCYFRHKADRSFRTRPPDMSLETVRAFAKGMREYALATGLTNVHVLFHGGEPLLRGPRYLSKAIRLIREEMPDGCLPHFSLQTNGSLLNQRFKEILIQAKASLSISLDGDRSAQDRHRIYSNGKSSFDSVSENVRRYLLDRDGERIFDGILAVVDLRNDPSKTFEYLSALCPNGIDFLLPDGTHAVPPPRITPRDFRLNNDYANWLIPVFDEWFKRGKRKPAIRFFENIMTLLLGGKSDVEGLGSQSLSILTIETDGEIRDSDVLCVAYEHASRFGSGHYIGEGCFEHLLESQEFQRQSALYSAEALSKECKACAWGYICGGGLLPHRYSTERGFNNPSVYCGNLKALVEHIASTLTFYFGSLGMLAEDVHPSGTEVNDMASIPDFLKVWDFPSSTIHYEVHLVSGPEGNISEGGDLENPSATILSSGHPQFNEAVEIGVRDLVSTLVERFNCITYSSCQGHRLPGVHCLRPRNVGILCRDQFEQQLIHNFLRDSSGKSQNGQPRIIKSWLRSGTDSFRTVEITFEENANDSRPYVCQIEGPYNVFVNELQQAWNFPSSWELSIDEDGSVSEQEILELKKLFADQKYSEMRVEKTKVLVENCEPYYRNEALSVEYQARHRKIGLINNHAWALLFWLASLGGRLQTDPEIGIHLIHVDYHSDLMSPRLFFDHSQNSWVDFFTRETVDLWQSNSVARAIHSSAVGPGSFILPFLHMVRARECHVDLIVPTIPSYDSDHFNGRRWIVRDTGPTMPGAEGSTMQIYSSESKSERVANINVSLPAGANLNVAQEQAIVILDIDLDFFSNKLNGTSNWAEGPGWDPDSETRKTLIEAVEGFLERMFEQRVPDIVTIAASQDFCPQPVAYEAFTRIEKSLARAGFNL